MPHLEAREHSLIWHQPHEVDEILHAWDRANKHFGAACSAHVLGWWEEYTHGHIVYPSPYYYIVGEEDGWLLTENRRHWVRPSVAYRDAVCAVEFVPLNMSPSLRYALADLERGSPFGFGPTRMRPGWDAVGCVDPNPEREHSEADPQPETLQALQWTSHGAVLTCPGHSIEIDRVWHWLARQDGLIAERDIEAYAVGWWQERDPGGSSYGVVHLAFDAPEHIWGFHHPVGTTHARWMYLDQWPIDVKPLPASAGSAFWAVEFVRRGQQPTLALPDLTNAVPRRKVEGIPARSPANNSAVLAAGNMALLNSTGRGLVSQPLPVLAGLCGLKDVERIIAFAWDCATWATDNEIPGEAWPAAHCRFWQHLWESGQRDRYLS